MEVSIRHWVSGPLCAAAAALCSINMCVCVMKRREPSHAWHTVCSTNLLAAAMGTHCQRRKCINVHFRLCGAKLWHSASTVEGVQGKNNNNCKPKNLLLRCLRVCVCEQLLCYRWAHVRAEREHAEISLALQQQQLHSLFAPNATHTHTRTHTRGT